MKTDRSVNIAVYSDDSTVRASIRSALGKAISEDISIKEIIDFATASALRLYVDSKKRVDLFILDGEAVPEGGMGVARQLKDEVFNCPPVLLITGRADDNWLATWSRAEGMVTHPIDPFNLAKKCAAIVNAAQVNSANPANTTVS